MDKMTDAGESNPIAASYTNRVLAFVDILGWSESTKNLEPMQLAKVLLEFESVRSSSVQARSLFGDANYDIKISFFSDTFLVSCPADNTPLMYNLLQKVSQLCRTLLCEHEMLTRGVITQGHLAHSEYVAYGPALSSAADLEKTDCHPRITIQNNLAPNLHHEGMRDITLDRDGEYFVDMFFGKEGRPFDSSPLSPIKLVDKAKLIVSRKIDATASNPRINRKWNWMKWYLDALP